MTVRRICLAAITVLLGAGVVVLPALAGSETVPAVEAVNGPGIYSHYWSPAHTTIPVGGTVAISNPTEVKHGVEWVGGPGTPVCTSGVPVGTSEAASGAKWSGTCNFAAAGTYSFYCTVHGSAMRGTVTVGETSTTTGTTSPAPAPTTPTGPGEPPGGSPPSAPPGAGSLLSGSATDAVRLVQGRHGRSVNASVDVAAAGAGSRLEIDLLAPRAALAAAHAAVWATVGRLVRFPLAAGVARFKVAVGARALRALRVHGHLALRVEVRLELTRGASIKVVRSLRLHA